MKNIQLRSQETIGVQKRLSLHFNKDYNALLQRSNLSVAWLIPISFWLSAPDGAALIVNQSVNIEGLPHPGQSPAIISIFILQIGCLAEAENRTCSPSEHQWHGDFIEQI